MYAYLRPLVVQEQSLSSYLSLSLGRGGAMPLNTKHRKVHMEGLLVRVKMFVIYLANTKCVICFLKEQTGKIAQTLFVLEIRKMVCEKSGR